MPFTVRSLGIEIFPFKSMDKAAVVEVAYVVGLDVARYRSPAEFLKVQ